MVAAEDRALLTQVQRDVADVAIELYTRRAGKKHGAWLWYEDDKLKVGLDDYFPNMTVMLEGECVFSRSGHGTVSIFRPGHWVNYLHQLAERARENRRTKRAARDEAAAEEKAARFAPVNDAHLFGADPSN